MNLTILSGEYAICRLSPDQAIPEWAQDRKQFLSITYTADELSIVCQLSAVPSGVRCEQPWKIIKVIGPLDFALTGIMADLTAPLAAGKVSIIAISTFDTDYLLIRAEQIERARDLLVQQGYVFIEDV